MSDANLLFYSEKEDQYATLCTRCIQTHFGIVKLTHSLTLSCIYLSVLGEKKLLS